MESKQPLVVKFYAKCTKKKEKNLTTETDNIRCSLLTYQDENYVTTDIYIRRPSIIFPPTNTIADILMLAARLKVERKMCAFNKFASTDRVFTVACRLRKATQTTNTCGNGHVCGANFEIC
jgi:hypothetical protein